MSNVLPADDKRKLQSRMRARLVTMFGVISMIGAGVAAVSLVPAYASVRIAHMEVMRSLAGQDELTSVKEDQVAASKAVAIANALKPIVNASTSPSSALAAALAVKPAGISITTIGYEKGELMLGGTSVGRDAVNAYRAALEADKRFSKVAIPVAALVGAQEGRFTVTLNGDF